MNKIYQKPFSGDKNAFNGLFGALRIKSHSRGVLSGIFHGYSSGFCCINGKNNEDPRQIPSGMTTPFHKALTCAGFTLIELLVVVLIIGILSAIALPQYQLSVRKAKYTQLMTAAKAYKDAFERYYMANGKYPAYWSDVDISFAGCTESSSAYYMLWCPNFSADSNVDPNANGGSLHLQFFSNPERNKEGAASGTDNAVFAIYMDQDSKAGKRACIGDVRLCKSLGGVPEDEKYWLP